MSRYRELYKTTAQKIAAANALVKQLESEGYGKLTVIPLAVKTAAKITGKGTAKPFIRGRATTIAEMEKLNNSLDMFLTSPWVSEEGRAEIRGKIQDTFSSGNSKLGAMSKREADLLIDAFENSAVVKARETKHMDSRTIAMAVKELVKQDKTAVTLERIFTEANEQNISPDEYFDFIMTRIKS